MGQANIISYMDYHNAFLNSVLASLTLALPSMAYPPLRSQQSWENMTRPASPLLYPPGAPISLREKFTRIKAVLENTDSDSDLISSHATPLFCSGLTASLWFLKHAKHVLSFPHKVLECTWLCSSVTFYVNPHKTNPLLPPQSPTQPPLTESLPLSVCCFPEHLSLT